MVNVERVCFWSCEMTVFEKTEIEALPVIEIAPTVRSIRVIKYFVFIVVVQATFVVSIFPPL